MAEVESSPPEKSESISLKTMKPSRPDAAEAVMPAQDDTAVPTEHLDNGVYDSAPPDGPTIAREGEVIANGHVEGGTDTEVQAGTAQDGVEKAKKDIPVGTEERTSKPAAGGVRKVLNSGVFGGTSHLPPQ